MSEDEGETDRKALLGIGTEPRTLAVVIGSFVLVIGLPALLFLLAGRTQVAVGLVAIFIVMVLATGHAFRKAVEAERVLRGEDDVGED